MKRLSIAGLAGLVFSLVLFYLMAQMIKPSGDPRGDRRDDQVISFTRSKAQSVTERRDRTPPQKPSDIQEDLPQPKMSSQPQQETPQMDFEPPQAGLVLARSAVGHGPGGGIGVAVSQHGNVGMGGHAGGGDAAPTPLVRIEPQYPRQAAMSGQEGWVQLRFDISAAGEVKNVEVIKSEPARIFDAAARSAVLKWKYRPQMQDGKPVERKQVMVQLDFKLRD
jgi:protein TonB